MWGHQRIARAVPSIGENQDSSGARRKTPLEKRLTRQDLFLSLECVPEGAVEVAQEFAVGGGCSGVGAALSRGLYGGDELKLYPVHRDRGSDAVKCLLTGTW